MTVLVADHQHVGQVPAHRVVVDADGDVLDAGVEVVLGPLDQVLARPPEAGLVQRREQHVVGLGRAARRRRAPARGRGPSRRPRPRSRTRPAPPGSRRPGSGRRRGSRRCRRAGRPRAGSAARPRRSSRRRRRPARAPPSPACARRRPRSGRSAPASRPRARAAGRGRPGRSARAPRRPRTRARRGCRCRCSPRRRGPARGTSGPPSGIHRVLDGLLGLLDRLVAHVGAPIPASVRSGFFTSAFSPAMIAWRAPGTPNS